MNCTPSHEIVFIRLKNRKESRKLFRDQPRPGLADVEIGDEDFPQRDEHLE
jgi:hypothetical protein